jgi:hypothetical protein
VYKFRKNKPKLNKYGLEEKEIYRTSDVCKLLNITPFTFRSRLYRGIWNDNYDQDGVGRMFTVDDLEKLKEINQGQPLSFVSRMTYRSVYNR